VGVAEFPPFYRERQIYIRTANRYLIVPLKLVYVFLLIILYTLPVGYWLLCGFVCMTGFVNEIFKLKKTHLGFHGICLGWIEAANPFEAFISSASKLGFSDGSNRFLVDSLPGCFNTTQRPCI